ncbi:MAG: type II secretion system F family protein [Pseudomonadota bacterium]
MTAFRYTARRPSGDLVEGQEDAPDRRALGRDLAAQGLLLVEARALRGRGLPRLRRGAVSQQAFLGFLSEFRHLTAAGLPVAKALSLLKAHPEDPGLGAAIASLEQGVARGLALDEAAAERADVFDELTRATFRAGHRTSRLADALEQLEAFLARRAEIERKIRRAMVYPTFLLGLLAVVLAGLMLFVLPRFADLYGEFGADLPAPTQVLMALVETAPFWIPASAGGMLALAALWRAAMRRPGPRRLRDRAALRSPVLGRIIRDTALQQMAAMLAMLLRAGAPLRPALEFVAEAMANTVIRDRLSHVAQEIGQGRALAEALAGTALLPPTTLGMIRAGELAGALPSLLDAVGAIHERAAEDRIDRVLALIEPVMILLVGVVLGTVIVTVYLPIFGISGVVQ